MKNLTTYLLIATSIILISSCNNDNVEDMVNEDIKLLEITESFYDNDSLISSSIINFTYGINNFVETEVNSSGNEKHYLYNSNNQLISYSYSNNGVIYNYTYNYDNGLIINQTDSNNNIIYTYNYNNQQQLIDINNTLFFTYYSNNNIATKTDSYGNIDYYEYDDMNNPYKLLFPESISKINYWTNNNILTENQTHYSIEYEYNDNDYPTKSTLTSLTTNGNTLKQIREYYYE
ncbi:hypothetical protein [uncultured Olleya sp.]|uniref:hypothetical protein n=1 Tax=uncultured Olleya sp. TaxID=757243 RepID=UPI0025929B6A|nr:hypothetical protein [uncultured Olleya sp.]